VPARKPCSEFSQYQSGAFCTTHGRLASEEAARLPLAMRLNQRAAYFLVIIYCSSALSTGESSSLFNSTSIADGNAACRLSSLAVHAGGYLPAQFDQTLGTTHSRPALSHKCH
jgi:hypothetical protein